MQRISALTLVCCVLLAACGAPEQPIAPEPPAAQQAPTDVSDQSQNVDSPPAADQLAPNATPQPRGKRLREVWPIAANKQPSITTLLYSDVLPVDDDETRARTAAFWRVDLNDVNNRQKIVEITSDQVLDVSLFGQLSPDGTHIAYIKPTLDSIGDLYVIRSDGSNDHRITTRIARTGGMCHRSFVWSLDGQQLAFVRSVERDRTYDDQISVYDLRSRTVVDSAKVGWAFLVGWQGPQGILAITSSGQGQPRVVDAINPVSNKRQAVATLPSSGFFCSNLSPDRQGILLDLSTGSYVFDTNTKAFRKTKSTASAAAWNPDSVTILDIADNGQGSGRISKVTQDLLSAESVTLGDATPSVRQGIMSASPDGHYLAVCEGRSIEPRGSRYRTMLYDVANDSWTPISEGQRCIMILGWQ